MSKEKLRGEHLDNSGLGEKFEEALDEENKNEQLRQRVLDALGNPDFIYFRDEYIKGVVENYGKLDKEAREEADMLVKEFIEMIEEYEKINNLKKAV